MLSQALRERHSSKMPAPYSQDLRRRLINAYYNKDGSQRQLAKRFQVSLTFVRNLLRHYRQTGTIEPKKHGGGTKTKIDNHGFAVIEQMIQPTFRTSICTIKIR